MASGSCSSSSSAASPRADHGFRPGFSRVAVAASRDEVEAILKEEKIDLVPANINSPRQIVLSGATAEIEKAIAIFEKRKVTARQLPVAAAFHSKLVSDASGPLLAGLAGMPFKSPQFPVYANTTAGVYPDDVNESRTLLANQLGMVKHQAQLLLGLCGLTITVTGFSGAHMIRAGSASAMTMVAGIALIQIAVVLCIRTLTKISWISQSLGESMTRTAEVAATHRNDQQQRLVVAGVFVGLGLATYLAAVIIAALGSDVV